MSEIDAARSLPPAWTTETIRATTRWKGKGYAVDPDFALF